MKTASSSSSSVAGPAAAVPPAWLRLARSNAAARPHEASDHQLRVLHLLPQGVYDILKFLPFDCPQLPHHFVALFLDLSLLGIVPRIHLRIRFSRSAAGAQIVGLPAEVAGCGQSEEEGESESARHRCNVKRRVLA